MGSWTRQPGEPTLYAEVPVGSITPARINAIAIHVSEQVGRTIEPVRVQRWLRTYTEQTTITVDGVEYLRIEMRTTDVARLPDIFSQRFKDASELRTPDDPQAGLADDVLGSEQGDL